MNCYETFNNQNENLHSISGNISSLFLLFPVNIK